MVLSDIEKIVKKVFEDHGYEPGETYLLHNSYLASFKLQNGVRLFLKENTECIDPRTIYELYYDELIVGQGSNLEECINVFIYCFYDQGGFDVV